jgi:hypothetical protein
MYKLILLICFFLTSIIVPQQIKKIELFDLIEMFSPSDGNILEWSTGAKTDGPIRWLTQTLGNTNDLKGYKNLEGLLGMNYREGKVVVTINSKPLTYLDYVEKPLEWTVMLFGPRGGFTTVQITNDQIGMNCFREECFAPYIKKQGGRLKILSSDDKKLLTEEGRLYEIKIKNKPPFYLTVRNGTGSAGYSGEIYITYQIPPDEFLKEIWNTGIIKK